VLQAERSNGLSPTSQTQESQHSGIQAHGSKKDKTPGSQAGVVADEVSGSFRPLMIQRVSSAGEKDTVTPQRIAR